MIDYVQSLWENPSEENLDRVNHEMWRASNIVVNYHYLLSQVTQKKWEIETPEILRIKRQIIQEEALIAECREVAKKIEEALKAKK
jgi:hypothetical protein